MYFNYFPLENDILNVYKSIDLSELTISEDYTLYTPNEGDNLMLISYKYYDTIEDWWIIFLFNNLYDINFTFLTHETIIRTSEYYLNLINSYISLSDKDKAFIKNIVFEFYRTFMTIEESIILTNQNLNSPTTTFLNLFNDYIEKEVINGVTIKIPSTTLLLSIKNYLEQKSNEWSQ